MVLKILERHKIIPTEQRIKVLEIVIALSTKQFSAEDVVTASRGQKPLLNKSVVSKVLRLYTVRGIIQSVELRRTFQRGRPELLFSLSAKLQNFDDEDD
jgi:Fe2+ or Zn2+ uptake regulation protein